MVLRRNKIIGNLQTKLINGEINKLQYLESISYQSKTNLEDIVPSDNDEIDSFLDAEEVYEPNGVVSQRLCLVCLVNEADTLIIPCRHAQTCYRCTDTIVNSD